MKKFTTQINSQNHEVTSSGSTKCALSLGVVKKASHAIEQQQQPLKQQHRDSGFIEVVSSSIISLNDEEPNPVVVVRKPPVGPLKVATAASTFMSSSHQHGRSFDDSGIGIHERELSFNNSSSTEIVCEDKCSGNQPATNRNDPGGQSRIMPSSPVAKVNCSLNVVNTNVNTVLFNNDENSLMNSKEISPMTNTTNPWYLFIISYMSLFLHFTYSSHLVFI